jgi:nucleoid-associated protein YgaU
VLTPTPVPPSTAAAAAGDAATWTVRPGECFWSIADDVLARAWGRRPTDAEIVPYWHVLIEQNRALLADRANADLIFPSQVFTVPPPPAPPVA